jgi:hypothetical protein
VSILVSSLFCFFVFNFNYQVFQTRFCMKGGGGAVVVDTNFNPQLPTNKTYITYVCA